MNVRTHCHNSFSLYCIVLSKVLLIMVFHNLLCLSPQIVIIEHKSIICPGYNAVLHIHTCIEEVQITVKHKLRATISCETTVLV